MNPRNFFAELKRRNVIRIAGLYLVGAWLLTQVATTLLPLFGEPEWLLRSIVILLAIGFIPALIFSWVFELTPEGLKREEDLPPEHSITPQSGRRMDRVIIVVLLFALGYFAFDKFVLTRRREAALMSSSVPNEPVINTKSIAVLPFENLSEEKANAFFADGVQDEILTDLAKIADLKVISRTSVMNYKTGIARNLREIGQQLGVAHVLEGSVQRAANRVRVNAQLVDTRTDRHLWAQTYDRDLADVFAIQSEIAKTIAEQLQAKLSSGENKAIERAPTTNVAAFDLYTQAKNLFLTSYTSDTGKAALLRATDLLNEAIAQDPSFFDAYCQLFFTEISLYFNGFDHTPVRLARAETALQAAAKLRPDAGETHLARARMLYWGYRKYDQALAELAHARRMLPSEPWAAALQGYIERRQGRWLESLRDLERAIDLDPRNTVTIQQTAVTYQVLRRYAEAKATWARWTAFATDDPTPKVSDAFVDLNWKADTKPMHDVIEATRAKTPAALTTIAGAWFVCAMAERDSAAGLQAIRNLTDNFTTTLGSSDNMSFSNSFLEGLVARWANDEAKAKSAFAAARVEQEKIVNAQPDYAEAVCVLGLIDAALGRNEEAIREGRRAVDLLPLERDALAGSAVVKYLTVIAAWAGDKDLALQQLEIATTHPCDLSYGQLKLLPLWDPLRGDPRFEKIVQSLAPK